ncbi:MAG TPA: ATP-binding protein [Terriglobales bacterium]|nr:ATP-binding protein [Terriglobales bacterium]
MQPKFQLKTKLVLAISGMVLALVSVLSYVYVAQVLRQGMTEAYQDGDFIAHQVYLFASSALREPSQAAQLLPPVIDDPDRLIVESLQSDPGLKSLLQSVVGYSPTIYDVSIVDLHGVAVVHSDPDFQGKISKGRVDFLTVRYGGFWRQLGVVYGRPRVYDVHLPLERGGQPFGQIRVGVSTVFLKSELQTLLNRAFTLAAIAIPISFLLAASLSNLALRPLQAIGARLDRMTAGEMDEPAEATPEQQRTDEYGVVTTKIDRLGRQMRDVKEVFSALKENLDQIMANLEDGLMLFTRDMRVVLVSASAERFVGQPRGDILGHRIDEIFSKSSRLGQLVLHCIEYHEPMDQFEVETDSGRRIQVSLDFIEERGERIGALLTMRDTESVRRIEDEIELSRRLAAIGRLTSGVAHEVKNPINAIVLHLEVLREKLPTLEPDSSRHLDVISSEIKRLDRVVQTLVDFTRPVELRLMETDLRRTLEDVVLLAIPDASQHGVRIVRQIASEQLPVRVDSDLIKQALLNVVINGVQAMPEGGELKIVASRNADEVEIRIQDQGQGVPTEVRDKIFNLYFTTKKGGSGIGLAMTYRVMQLHNGSIDFESRNGNGTTFFLRLPVSGMAEIVPPNLATSARSAEGQG